MAVGIKFELNQSIYNRDPQETELGRKLIEHSILLIDELGLEGFNFKKLALAISSTEASIYRYFDNKHLLLIYLSSWYWEWVHYLIDLNVMNIENPEKALKITIHNIIFAMSENPLNQYVNENVLHKMVIKESAKAYHTSKVDNENQNGLFESYITLVKRVAELIKNVNPQFKYAQSLASNLFEMANNQIYFAEHIPQLTDLSNKPSCNQDLEDLLNHFAFKVLS